MSLQEILQHADGFNVIWKKFLYSFPIVEKIVSNRDFQNFKEKFVEKYKNMCDNNIDILSSNCLLERFIASLGNSENSRQFKVEVSEIINVANKAWIIASKNPCLIAKIKDIIRNLVLTIDVDHCSKNNDYRNRVNELLAFNWLSNCSNLTIKTIEYPLDNNRSCDFECIHMDGTQLLFEVLSINNIDINKQNNSKTFSKFINDKIEKKYSQKTQNLAISNLKIFPMIEYTMGLEDFDIQINECISLMPFL